MLPRCAAAAHPYSFDRRAPIRTKISVAGFVPGLRHACRVAFWMTTSPALSATVSPSSNPRDLTFQQDSAVRAVGGVHPRIFGDPAAKNCRIAGARRRPAGPKRRDAANPPAGLHQERSAGCPANRSLRDLARSGRTAARARRYLD